MGVDAVNEEESTGIGVCMDRSGRGLKRDGKVPPLVFLAGPLVGTACFSKVPIERNDLH